jgi:hypothetical protein
MRILHGSVGVMACDAICTSVMHTATRKEEAVADDGPLFRSPRSRLGQAPRGGRKRNQWVDGWLPPLGGAMGSRTRRKLEGTMGQRSRGMNTAHAHVITTTCQRPMRLGRPASACRKGAPYCQQTNCQYKPHFIATGRGWWGQAPRAQGMLHVCTLSGGGQARGPRGEGRPAARAHARMACPPRL